MSGGHTFWPDDVSLLDAGRIDAPRLAGHRVVSDVYLLALAVSHEGALTTLDRSVRVEAVRDATPDRLVVLG